MYFSAQPPPERLDGALRALRLSLNTPVVEVEELPVAPARAGIALERGDPLRLLVAVRSLRTGRVACYAAAAEDVDEARDSRLALDAALAFAESMGFLFDDDAVAAAGDAGEAEGARLWRELLGIDAPETADPLLLEDVVPAASNVLTKFRRSELRAQENQGGGHG